MLAKLALFASLLATLLVGTGAVRMTAAEKTDVLLQHNRYRCNVSPLAASMPRVTWDSNLEIVAQTYADKCPGGHNSNRTNMYNALTGGPATYVGENLAWGYSTPGAAIQGFGNENKYYTFSSNSCASGQMCGHYTQVVWSTSVRVACAKPTGSCPTWGDKVYVCDYAPGGNVAGRTPYTSSTTVVTTDACVAAGITPTTVKTTTRTTVRTTTKTGTTKTTTKATTRPSTGSCPSSGVANKLRCRKYGAYCDVIGSGWGCCQALGGRMACPPEKPVLCASKTCSTFSTDHCCDIASANCASYGGPATVCPTQI